MARMGHYIGQNSQQVFVKHSSFYARKHPCRLQLIKPASQLPKEMTQVSRKWTKIVPSKIHSEYQYETTSDSENRNKNH